MRRSGPIAFAVVAAALLSAISVATSQEIAEARSGEEVRVGWIGSVGENCLPNAAPAIEPAKLATSGQIRVVEGEVTTDSITGCPDLTLPAKIVFYKSSPSFIGTDEFAFTVKGGDVEDVRTYRVTVVGGI